MGRSRRKYKQSRPKVRVGLPKKNPKLLKPAFTIPPKLLESLAKDPKWDTTGSVTQNYHSFGVVSDPNSLTDSLPLPSVSDDLNDSGSDLEEDDLKSALGKQRRDGYDDGYKAKSFAAFDWNLTEIVHELLHT